MWLELGVPALLLLATGQTILLVKLWRQSRSLQQRVDALWQNAAGASTDVPTSMLVTVLGRVERKLGQVERPVLPERSWELAKQLAREGADVEQLVACCGLSRDEAQLILAMRASLV
ncbi:DUF2802 domain-containing protein [Rhodanobacter sp. DHB23]|uniref:DUF2802 domain-containing protein n=1 Tax=Rhodanobacter sp. DHB23 TaxID=2775923 RepID=UPI00178229D5|nr:DUF2802 domain-containing protein [Rhodanobacter sp. DHB23]MBD8871434.1 DUF2802 domain-containing protein [Rhodanobacter sp. DHB23]